jgi:peptide chain release factor 1
MYSKFAERQGWRLEVMSSSDTGTGGLKEVIASVDGRGAYSKLKYESGVHRVQRVPATEASGRIHTSTVTVAVLRKRRRSTWASAKGTQIDVYCSGVRGQSVNTIESAVRITHRPRASSTRQDEKSQHKNKAKAMKVLLARLLELERQKQHEAISASRRSQVGTGDRSERIRTYNFPQGRVTDHRIGLTLHKIDRILEGELDDLIDPLAAHFQAEALKEASGGVPASLHDARDAGASSIAGLPEPRADAEVLSPRARRGAASFLRRDER